MSKGAFGDTKKLYFTFILAITILAIVINPYVKPEKPEVITAQLIEVKGGSFSESSGYYGGELILTDISTRQFNYSFSVCSKNWSWVRKNSCYELNLSDIKKNIEGHIYSAELSGCYIGSFKEVSCERG
ncbi:MAG: hypothetical protein QW040_02015 [Candidatus Aenigmatarchaeota archaeon]